MKNLRTNEMRVMSRYDLGGTTNSHIMSERKIVIDGVEYENGGLDDGMVKLINSRNGDIWKLKEA